MASATPVAASEPTSSTRVAGVDRYGTAVEISKATFADGSDDVVLATGQVFADALAGNGVAGALDAPILLTPRNTLDARTAAEIDRLGAENVWIMGGTAAVSQSVENALDDDLNVVRVEGTDRIKTAVDGANVIAENGGIGEIDGETTAILVNGFRFPDAVSASPAAFNLGLPVLLTHGDNLTDDTAAALEDLDIERVLIVGGTAVVNAGVATEVGTIVDTVDRYAGNDRYGTAAAFAQEFLLDELGWDGPEYDLATGQAFADALSGGPHAGSIEAPILLTPTNTLATDTATFLTTNCEMFDVQIVLGGTAAVSQATAAAAAAAAQCETTGNQTFSVGPDSPAVNTVSTSAGDDRDRGRREYTATVGNVGSVDIALIPSTSVQVDGETVRFADNNQNNRADGLGATGARIESVNGVANTGEYANSVVPINGQITFVIDSENANVAVQPIVFTDTDPNNQLNLNDQSCEGVSPSRFCEPTTAESFGVGGLKLWVPVEATDQTFLAEQVIIPLQILDLFTSQNRTYNYATQDTFRYNSGTASNILITMADFERDLSGFGRNGNVAGFANRAVQDQTTAGYVRGDIVDVDYNRTGPSAFTIQDDTPAAPSNVTATVGNFDTGTTSNDIQVTWTAPANRDVAGYDIFRAPVNEAGVVGAYQPVGNTTGKTSTTFNDFNRAAGTYSYVVLAYNAAGWYSPNSNTAQATMLSTAQTLTPVSTNIQHVDGTGTVLNPNLPNTIDAGDTITITFVNGPVTLNNPSVAIRDADGTRVVLNSSNSTFTVGGTNDTIVTINVNTTPTPQGSVGGNNLIDTATAAIVRDGTSGIGNVAGEWNLPRSGCVDGANGCPDPTVNQDYERTVFGTNASLPNAVPQNQVQVNPANNTVTIQAGATFISNGDPFEISNANGVVIATGTYNSGAGTTVTTNPGFNAGDALHLVYTDVSQSRLPSETTVLINPGAAPVATSATGGTAANQIRVNWDRPINQIGSPENYRVFDANNNTEVARGISTVPTPGSGTSATTVVVTLNNALTPGTNYVVRIAQGTVESTVGNVPNAAQQLTLNNFQVDNVGPDVTTITANEGASTFTVTFNEPVAANSVQNSDFITTRGSVTGFTFNGARTVATVTISAPLQSGDTVGVGANSVQDDFGNTGPAEARTQPVSNVSAPASTSASIADNDGSSSYTVGDVITIVFNEPMDTLSVPASGEGFCIDAGECIDNVTEANYQWINPTTLRITVTAASVCTASGTCPLPVEIDFFDAAIRDLAGNPWVGAGDTTLEDPSGPLVASDDADAGDTEFRVTFNEPVTVTSAQNTGNYTVTTNGTIVTTVISAVCENTTGTTCTQVRINVGSPLANGADLDQTVVDQFGNAGTQTGYVLVPMP